ncbi:MAG: methyltransferase domain-containing protein [Clostridia bacterium]|nr:methyltransferase domain-containing protein [Clostridia bacterium]
MLERTQDRSKLSWLGEKMTTQLHGAQKAMAQWAIVDDYDAILDMRCNDVSLLRHLSRRFSLRACGITENAAEAKEMQESLPEAEIFCARKEDIPWRDDCFDAVFYQINKKENGDCGFLKEAMRVLKPNGQMLIAVHGLPEVICGAAEMAGVGEMEGHLKPHALLKAMEAAGFADVSYRISRPLVGIAMGWKRN